MGDSLKVYGTLMTIFCQYLRVGPGPHLGQLKTLAWCVTGLLLTNKIHIPQWASAIISSARQQASRERRLYRWLTNPKVDPERLYGPLIQEALRRWVGQRLYLALDTTSVQGQFTIIYLSVIHRGRAVPIIWSVVRSASTTVRFESYQSLLIRAAKLLPPKAKVVLLADRGFCDMRLMQAARDLNWGFRIRIKSAVWVYWPGQRPGTKVGRLCPGLGEARFYHKVWLTKQQLGPVHLALAWCQRDGKTEPWYVVSDEPTDITTFDEYGLRFDTEELFLDQKSANFQLEATRLRDEMALSRLALVLAVTVLTLTSWGTTAVTLQLRRAFDAHWLRGLSYLRIGLHAMRQWLGQRRTLPTWLALDSRPDPEPAYASLRQARAPGPAFNVVTVP